MANIMVKIEVWLLFVSLMLQMSDANKQFSNGKKQDKTEKHGEPLRSYYLRQSEHKRINVPMPSTKYFRESFRLTKIKNYLRETPSSDIRFVTNNNTVVESQVGATAILHCKTSSTTGGLVSWIRKRDYQLLTVGLQSHSSDDRFSINYVHWDWQLHVRYVQPRDAGAYECQVSSHPPASIFVHLDVVEAEAEILGSPEKHVKSGSILRLVCILHHTTEAPAYVFWYRGSDMINYGEEQSIVVESDEHTSVLLVSKASRKHSGNYTCVPSNAKPAFILVHILTGEYPAAMQHGQSSSLQPHLLLSLISIVISILIFPQNAEINFLYNRRSEKTNDPDTDIRSNHKKIIFPKRRKPSLCSHPEKIQPEDISVRTDFKPLPSIKTNPFNKFNENNTDTSATASTTKSRRCLLSPLHFLKPTKGLGEYSNQISRRMEIDR